jgi:creatinine amidohydrolase
VTEIFAFDELTWPEVDRLPRRVPLVLPLGAAIPTDALVRSLGSPPRLGALPALPFGWRGSDLELPDRLLAAVVAGLVASLNEDGFDHVFVAAPPDVGGDWGIPRVELPEERSPVPVGRAVHHAGAADRCLIIPVGHTEQHAYHLPLNTDTAIVEAIAREVVRSLPGEAAALPVMPYGVSTHRAAYPGTLNAGGRAFEDFWLGALDVLIGRGFDKIYFLSGHGGNMSFLVNVVKYGGERHRRAFIATAWLYLSGPQGLAALNQRRRSAPGGMGHAGELETSLMLHLRPDLVRMDRVQDETRFVTTASFGMEWVEAGPLVANPPWEDDTVSGAYGAGSLADADNGAFWFAAAVEEKVQHVREIHDQQRRREARRREGWGRWSRRRAGSPDASS